MCGLFGFIGNITNRHKAMFDYGMFATGIVRGPDSIGVLRVTKDLDYRIEKSLGMYPDLVMEDRIAAHGKEDYVPFMAKNGVIEGECYALLGHARKATQGKVNVENAHPFEFDNIIGAHNGTIPKFDLRKLSDAHDKYEIDSQVLMHEIDNADGDIEKVWKKLDGAAACWVYDKHSKEVMFFRNSQRPLFFFTTKQNDLVCFTSEPWIFFQAAKRFGDTSRWSVQEKAVDHELPVNTLRTFALPDEDEDLDLTPLDEKMETYVGTYSNFHRGGGANSGTNWENANRYKGSSAVVPFEGRQVNEKGSVFVDLPGSKSAPIHRSNGSPQPFVELNPTDDWEGGYIWDDCLEMFVWYCHQTDLLYPYHHREVFRTGQRFRVPYQQAEIKQHRLIYKNYEGFNHLNPKTSKERPDLPAHYWVKVSFDPTQKMFVVPMRNVFAGTTSLKFGFDHHLTKHLRKFSDEPINGTYWLTTTPKAWTNDKTSVSVPLDNLFTYGTLSKATEGKDNGKKFATVH